MFATAGDDFPGGPRPTGAGAKKKNGSPGGAAGPGANPLVTPNSQQVLPASADPNSGGVPDCAGQGGCSLAAAADGKGSVSMLAAPTWASVTALTPDGAGLPQVDPGVDRGSEVAGGTESATTAQGKQSALQANSPVDDPETVSSAATSQALGPLPPLATPQLTPVNPIPFDPRTRAMARTTMAAKYAQESTVDSAQAREVDP